MTPEQVFLDAALRNWRSNMDRASKFFSSLTSDELELEVAPARNRLVYIWGHLTAVNDAILPLFGFGQRRYPELDNTFVSPVDHAVLQIPSGSELNQIWTELDLVLWAEFQSSPHLNGCNGTRAFLLKTSSENHTATGTRARLAGLLIWPTTMARRYLQNAGEVSIHLKGDLPLIWRMIHTTRRNGRAAVISAILCGGIPAYAAMIQEQAHLAPAHDVAQDPLEDRVSSAPESLLKRFSNELNVNVSAHIVTPGERITLANALAQLTPLQHEVLLNRLHAIYFIDGLPGNALTFQTEDRQPSRSSTSLSAQERCTRLYLNS